MSAKDLYSDFGPSTTGPIEHAQLVSPDDTTDLPWVTRSIMVASEGNIAGRLKGGEDVVLQGLKPGILYPFRFTRIAAAGTTATGILGLW